jgi:hypothetical protein
MKFPEMFRPEDLTNDALQTIYEQAGLETDYDSEGDLVVTRGVTCYAIPTPDRARILLLSFVGIKDGVERDDKLEFANRVNNQIAAVRAHVNAKGAVVFDSPIPIEGGIAADAIVAATQFFLIAIAHAIDLCDEADIVR